MNKEGDEPVKLNDRRVEYTIHVKRISFGGGDDSDNEYLVTITREDRKRKDTFIEGDMGAELDNGAMFAILSDIYKEEEKGKKEREYTLTNLNFLQKCVYIRIIRLHSSAMIIKLRHLSNGNSNVRQTLFTISI